LAFDRLRFFRPAREAIFSDPFSASTWSVTWAAVPVRSRTIPSLRNERHSSAGEPVRTGITGHL